MEANAKQILHLSEKKGVYCLPIAPTSGKVAMCMPMHDDNYTLIRASFPYFRCIFDLKCRQNIIITSVFEDAHACSLQTREKKSLLFVWAGISSKLVLSSHPHKPPHVGPKLSPHSTEGKLQCSLLVLIRGDAWIALFSWAHGGQPIFISSLKEGKSRSQLKAFLSRIPWYSISHTGRLILQAASPPNPPAKKGPCCETAGW